jgi:hypothetical protein
LRKAQSNEGCRSNRQRHHDKHAKLPVSGTQLPYVDVEETGRETEKDEDEAKV